MKNIVSKKRRRITPAVFIILQNKDKILLSKRCNTGYMDGKYSFVSGHIKKNELMAQALIREVYEEIGIVIKERDLRLVHIVSKIGSDKYNRLDLFFTANKWIGTIANKEVDKSSRVAWFQKDKLPKLIVPYLVIVMDKIRKGITYSQLNDNDFI